ncbi:hypothetical protein PROFUN_12922 [Planoprotostelium fungivorum]|uniref:Uncharacterized protein n=1 Tax=Planoprotostelium fungivorum TaxID=1890364 RepID=A0A2P6N5Y6_9EUKA|nr:hypothetical protein PROFUN_12922 [Planoprotostelium fungivorum]
MSNGTISSHDATKAILYFALNKGRRETNDTTRRRFAVLRLTCKLWKDIEGPNVFRAHVQLSQEFIQLCLMEESIGSPLGM